MIKPAKHTQYDGRTGALNRHVWALIAGCVGLVASLALFAVVYQSEQRRQKSDFERSAERTVAALSQEMEAQLFVLQGLAALYDSSEAITRQGFHAFVKRFADHIRSVRSLEWIPMVRDADRAMFEEAGQRNGFPRFMITEKDPSGKMIRSTKRDEYFPVLYIAPYAGNEAALGWDLGSNAARLALLNLARDSGKPAATGRVILVRDNLSEPSFLVVLPVYRKGVTSDSVEARRTHLVGFFRAVFRIRDVVEGAFRYQNPQGLDVYLFDESAPAGERLLYFHSSRGRTTVDEPANEDTISEAPVNFKETLKVAQRNWLVRVAPAPGGLTGNTWLAWIGLLGGLLFTGTMTRHIWLVQRSADNSARYATDQEISRKNLENEIVERKQLERELREKEERYRTIADFTYDWESWTGPKEECLWVSPSCRRVTGYAAEDFMKEPGLFERIIYPDDLELVMNHFNRSSELDRTTPQSLDFRIVRKDGEIRWINHVSQPVVGEGGKSLGKRSSNRDVTDRINAEQSLKASEDRFRQIYENSPVMMHSIDADGILRNVNERWLEVLGYSREDVLGHSVGLVMTPESASRAASIILPQYWQTGSVRDVPYQYVTKEGTLLDVLLDSVVMEDPLWGKTSLSVVRNITQRKRAEEETKRTKALLNSIIQNLPTSVFLKEAEGLQYILWNRASEGLYGLSGEEVIGKTAHDFFPEDVADSFDAQDRQALASGNLLCVPEQTVDTRGKGTRIVHTKKLPILDDDGKPRYIVGISEDITERKEAEKALIMAREAAEQTSRAKSEFLANMSHEIRTPINGIMGMTQLALNTQLTAEQAEFLEAVETSADCLLRLINDILDFSKMEAGKLELISIDFSLRDSIADTMTTLALQAHTKGLELLYQIPPNIPDALIGDPGRLRQILLNLVANAVKFTERGEVGVKIEPESETGDEIRLHFSIADTGIGIPAEKQQKIFNAFEQADGSTSRKYGGTGLGLAISSELVRMMDGRIWLESEPEKGSVFHFSVRFGIPREIVQQPIACDLSALKDLSVLVVDDNATNRRILEETLLQWQIKPTIADSGPAALAAMKSEWAEGRQFDLVITDCMMPEMDGFQFVEKINQDAHVTAPTIIMLTSAGERGDAARCMKLKIAAYLLKPIKQSELCFTISRVLKDPQAGPARPSLITRHSIRESAQRLQILLAEDNAVNQKLAVRMLERMGHTVSVAANGREALDILALRHFDIVLMDVQMPIMDGLEATTIIRESERTSGAHVPIVAMTAYAMKGDKEKCIEAGMDGYVSKPVNAQELFETLEELSRKTDAEPPAEARPAPRNQFFNKTEILDRVGGDETLLKEIVDLFISDQPRLIAMIRTAVRESDAEGLEKAAHALKGSVGNFASESTFQAALRLEIMGRNRDMAQAPEAVIDLENKVRLLQEQLVSMIEEIDR